MKASSTFASLPNPLSLPKQVMPKPSTIKPAPAVLELITKKKGSGLSDRDAKKADTSQLPALVEAGAVVNEDGYWYLHSLAPSTRIKAWLLDQPEGKLFTASAIGSALKLSARQKPKAAPFLRSLATSGAAVKFISSGKELFGKALPTTSSTSATPTSVTPEQVLQWISATSERLGWRSVPIAEVMAVATCSLAELVAVIDEMCAQGSVNPGRGDDSLDPPIYKHAAILVGHTPHYYVCRI
jgi:hypothetical protein